MSKTAWNKGLKMSQVTKDKISSSRSGKPAWNKGKTWSEETKKKISAGKKGQPAWNIGKSWPKTTRDKIRGSKLALTIDIKPFYERNITSKRLRYSVFKRDNFRCQSCGRTANEVVLE